MKKRKQKTLAKVEKPFDEASATAALIEELKAREKKTKDPKRLALLRSTREKTELFLRFEMGDEDALIELSKQCLGQADQ